MGKKDSKKNNSNRRRSKSLLKMLSGGENENVVETEKTPEKKSAFDFFDKFSPPKDYASKNGADEEIEPVSKSKNIFSSPAAIAATATTAASVSNANSDASTGWFVFRVMIVIIIAIIFVMSMTGYLDDLTSWIRNTLGPYINPILVKIGIMESTPTTRATGSDNTAGTGTDNIQQLEDNIGSPPEHHEHREHSEDHEYREKNKHTKNEYQENNTYNNNGQYNEHSEHSKHKEEEKMHRIQQKQQEQINSLKPIPIQPNERQTPLKNKGESARPPASQPAPYQEEKSREQEKREAIHKALDYAAKNPKYPSPDQSTSTTQLSRSGKGYCFVGEDRGHRTCAELSANQQCMSGNIFPSMDMCVNPQLRL